MPDISYQEKTIWGSLITMAVAATVYFARVLAALGEEGPSPAGVTWFGLGLLFVLLVVETVYSILLAASSRVEKRMNGIAPSMRAPTARPTSSWFPG